MKSPFKFLDAYTAADKDIFFGREEEVEALYNMVFKTPLVLVYGMSGTGKTSLIQCGLASRFDGPDWLPFYIRRDKNINTSIEQAFNIALKGKTFSTLRSAVENLFYTYFRPVYLIFDQFEELFIMGSIKEQQLFLENIQQLIDEELPCKVLLVMREEYLGQLYDFEKVVPGIFDFKLRVESMSNKRVRRVMMESFKEFNIQLEEPQDDHCQQMIENISAGKSGIPLTYLQVYLDMLYREDYERTYPEGIDMRLPPLEFTKKEIDDFGEINDVLERYLKEQTVNIQQKLQHQFLEIHENTIKSVLDAFVTEEGTKRPVSYNRSKDIYLLEQSIEERLQIPKEILSFCISHLDQARLIRLDDDTIELGHDTLAELIHNQRTKEQKELNDIKKRLLSDYKYYGLTKEFLSQKRLNTYNNYISALALNEEVLKFIDDSRAYNHAQEKAEQERKNREVQLIRDKLAAKDKARKRLTSFSIVLGFAFLIASGLGWSYYNQRNIATKKTVEADNLNEKLVNAFINIASKEYEEKFIEADSIYQYSEGDLTQAEELAIQTKDVITKYINELSQKENVDSLLMIKFKMAIDNNGNKADSLVQRIKEDALNLTHYNEYINKGIREIAKNKYKEALSDYQKAHDLIPRKSTLVRIEEITKLGYDFHYKRSQIFFNRGTLATTDQGNKELKDAEFFKNYLSKQNNENRKN